MSIAYHEEPGGNGGEEDYAYFGFLDGHGGPVAAVYVKEHLLTNIVSQRNFWKEEDSSVLRAIRDGFLKTHHAMRKEVGKRKLFILLLPFSVPSLN